MPERRIRRKPGENRAHLVQAGLTEFGLYGYHGASTAAIAARADVPQPHVYASFPAKRDLFLECLAVAVRHATSGQCEPFDSAKCPHELLIFQAYAASAHPDLGGKVQPLISELAPSGSGLLERASRALIAAS